MLYIHTKMVSVHTNEKFVFYLSTKYSVSEWNLRSLKLDDVTFDDDFWCDYETTSTLS